MNNKDLKELAAQLRKPDGDSGMEVAKMMHTSNIGMIRHAIDNLSIQQGDKILELGHGNGHHLSYLFSKNDALSYYGLEISGLMHQQAHEFSREQSYLPKTKFYLYDGKNMPLENNSFDKIFTVNTIYFWEQPTEVFQELFRVLRPEGLLCITFAHKDFMQQLPFVQYGFELYNVEHLQALANDNSFIVNDIQTQTETVISKNGDKVTRTFSTVVLKK